MAAKRRRTSDTINFLSTRHATSSIAILFIAAALISPIRAFSPIYIKRNLVSSIIINECRVGYCTHDMCLHASEEDDNDNSNESDNVEASGDDKDNMNNAISSEANIDDGDDDDEELDIITQRLRRNAENVINPIKEVERMKQENENEASNNSTSSTLYSQMVAEVVDPGKQQHNCNCDNS